MKGVGLQSMSDSELVTQVLSVSTPEGEENIPDWPMRVKQLMKATPTSYALTILYADKVYGVRDPYGNRPLCIGKVMPQGSESMYLVPYTHQKVIQFILNIF